jgi:serine protease Do
MMSTRRSTFFYGLLISLASVLVGMVLASRLGLSPQSSAQTAFTAPPANSAPLSGPVDATTFRAIAKNVSPSVVNIRTESRQRTQELSDFFGGPDSPLDRFFGPAPRGQQPPPERERKVRSAGTGFIIDKSGLILTNNHVVEGTTRIQVSLYGEDEDQLYEARIVGRDPLTDSALIQLTDKVDHVLPEIKFGDSDQMQTGDWVVAIGNPFGFSHTVSVGVISGIGREFNVVEDGTRKARVIQTDAAINPGNSGGPLLNLRGEVIGMNTAIYADARQQGNIGIGFAMPINMVRELLPQLRTGKITRGRIGIEVGDVDRDAIDELKLSNRDGAMVGSVLAGGAAEKAGLEAGDVITTYNSKPVKRSEDLVSMVTATKPGTTVPMRVIRDGQERRINITVDELDLEAESKQSLSSRAAPEREPELDRETSRGFGIRMQDITPDIQRQLRLSSGNGAVITQVEPDSPADAVGLRRGDVIVRVGAQRIQSSDDAVRELARVPAGGSALLRIMRTDGQGTSRERFVTVTKE